MNVDHSGLKVLNPALRVGGWANFICIALFCVGSDTALYQSYCISKVFIVSEVLLWNIARCFFTRAKNKIYPRLADIPVLRLGLLHNYKASLWTMFLLLPSVPVYRIFHPPFWISVRNILRVSDFFLWFWCPLSKSAKFMVSTSFKSGLLFWTNIRHKISSPISNPSWKTLWISEFSL